MQSLFKNDNHIVVDVETDVAVGFILNTKATSKQTKTMPRLSILSIELGLDVFCHIAVVARSETFECLDGCYYGKLRHFWLHVVPLDPYPSVCVCAIYF